MNLTYWQRLNWQIGLGLGNIGLKWLHSGGYSPTNTFMKYRDKGLFAFVSGTISLQNTNAKAVAGEGPFAWYKSANFGIWFN